MSFFKWFHKKKQTSSKTQEEPINLNTQAQKSKQLTDEQAEQMARALSQYLKQSK